GPAPRRPRGAPGPGPRCRGRYGGPPARQRTRRRKADPASRAETRLIATHQPTADHSAASTRDSSSNARNASTTADSGWLLAKPWTHDGMVETGTSALLGLTRKKAKKENPVAASGDRTTSPTTAESHEIATTSRRSSAKATTTSRGRVCGRKPMISAVTKTVTMDRAFRT